MQEEIENRTVNLAISTTKLTARSMIRGFQAWQRYYKSKAAEKPKGKQSVKELVGQNQGVSSIPIEKTGIRDFQVSANKFGVDFAITKDKAADTPRYTVFFKAKDADALTAAFTEYSNKKLRKQERPSVLQQLEKLKSIVAAIPDKVRHKSQERDSR